MASISVVLPAYNEQEVITNTVRAVDAAVSALVDDFEIIVVNDGSRDATAERLTALQATCARLRIETHAQNRGYGAALATGFDAARTVLVMTSCSL